MSASAQLLVAPAGHGKTAYLVDLVRRTSSDLQAMPYVLVASPLQVHAWRHRLALAGGALGVRVSTFDGLYRDCLRQACESQIHLSEPVQFRLLRAAIDKLPLTHYAPIRRRPGFISVLERLVCEFQEAQVTPDAFARAVAGIGNAPRLSEIAQIYDAYAEQMRSQRWVDQGRLGWRALDVLEADPGPLANCSLIACDGFASFTPLQLAFLSSLAKRVGQLVISLTGTIGSVRQGWAHRRFERTRQDLEQAMGAKAESLPEHGCRHAASLAHLEKNLFSGCPDRVDAGGAIEMIEAADRAGEARVALRWLKARLMEDGMRPAEIALLARSIGSYRPFILETASEFGLPIRLVDGLPLAENPAIAAIMDLLRLVLPLNTELAEPALPWRLVVEAWRSPYLDWSAALDESDQEAIGIVDGDAAALERTARWGRVIGGLSQWREILDSLAARLPDDEQAVDDDERGVSGDVPSGATAEALRGKFNRFLRRVTPPAGAHPYRKFVGWLETLIGADPATQDARFAQPEEPTSLQIVKCARAGGVATRERDLAALEAFKDCLRGLVWAEEALKTTPVDFVTFLQELAGTVEGASYRLPLVAGREEILVADVKEARGLAFRAVAVLGMAEGEFPATIREDPFLRDADRRQLREEHGLRLEPSITSREPELFYEAIMRARERLLLVRPRLADNGSPWEASPFWEEVCRLVAAPVDSIGNEAAQSPLEAASWPELMESLAARPEREGSGCQARQAAQERFTAFDAATDLLRHRTRRPHTSQGSAFDGDLNKLENEFAQLHGPDRTWSASRLESYRTCPFGFFIGSVLRLERRQDITEGLDDLQLGNIYHRILARLYCSVTAWDVQSLLAALPSVAAEILDDAPGREGFRKTAWWGQTRLEIEANIRRSLAALASCSDGFTPFAFEQPFFGPRSLTVEDGLDSFRLHGVIDRVDRSASGAIRIIDYKSGGAGTYDKPALTKGKKLQVPLYALAARDALQLGQPVDGFYWHVKQGERSAFTLASFDGGPEGAMQVAVHKAWEAIRGARTGQFRPTPPEDGCRNFCPGGDFCWHFRPGFGG